METATQFCGMPDEILAFTWACDQLAKAFMNVQHFPWQLWDGARTRIASHDHIEICMECHVLPFCSPRDDVASEQMLEVVHFLILVVSG
jgi:hypothetical protein